MLMKMLADMAGITPEKLEQEINGFQKLATESREALARIETNTQENGVMLRAICAQLKIEVPENVRRHGDNHGNAGTGSGPG